MAALVNRKDTMSAYIGGANATDVTLADKLVNLASVGDIGGTVGEIETNFLDEGKKKYPDEAEYDAITIEQSLLTVEHEKLYGYFQNGTIFPFSLYVDRQDGTTLLGFKQTGYISEYKIAGGQIGETMLANYSIQPTGALVPTTTKPAQ